MNYQNQYDQAPNQNPYQQPPQQQKKNWNDVGRFGAILNVILSIMFAIMLFWTIIFLIMCIWTAVANIRYLKGANNKVLAGILGLFFSGLLGGILVLISREQPQVTDYYTGNQPQQYGDNQYQQQQYTPNEPVQNNNQSQNQNNSLDQNNDNQNQNNN